MFERSSKSVVVVVVYVEFCYTPSLVYELYAVYLTNLRTTCCALNCMQMRKCKRARWRGGEERERVENLPKRNEKKNVRKKNWDAGRVAVRTNLRRRRERTTLFVFQKNATNFNTIYYNKNVSVERLLGCLSLCICLSKHRHAGPLYKMAELVLIE